MDILSDEITNQPILRNVKVPNKLKFTHVDLQREPSESTDLASHISFHNLAIIEIHKNIINTIEKGAFIAMLYFDPSKQF